MLNRWGRQPDPKPSHRNSGQNNINININFNANALKDKNHLGGTTQGFIGKKIDNFIQISNEPKNNNNHILSRPNVSMETLKYRKKNGKDKQAVREKQKDKIYGGWDRGWEKQENVMEYELQRKKSKGKIDPIYPNDIYTPEKNVKQRQLGNSKSVGKKSTKKRSSKSYDNLKKYYDRNSPKIKNIAQRKQDIIQQKNQRTNSKSKSRSRSKSNKKLIKNSSKSKIQTNSTNTKTKNTAHNSKNQDQTKPRQKHSLPNHNIPVAPTVPLITKSKKHSIKKGQKLTIKQQQPSRSQSQIQIQTLKQGQIQNKQQQPLTKKSSTDKISRKKYSHVQFQNQNKKTNYNKIKTPKKRSKQKQHQSLQRRPLFYQQQQLQQQNQNNTYKKIQKQAQQLLYQQQQNSHSKNKKSTKNKPSSSKKSSSVSLPYQHYLTKSCTYTDMIKLTQCATIIQKNWRGYRIRVQFINQLNMMAYKIQLTRNKIENIDAKFWDDGKSNSILRVSDVQEGQDSGRNAKERRRQEQIISQLNSQIQKPISSERSSIQDSRNNKSQNPMKKNRILQKQPQSQHQNQHEKPINPSSNNTNNLNSQILQRITRLQQNLKKQQAKALQLQQQNKQLKVNLQKQKSHQTSHNISDNHTPNNNKNTNITNPININHNNNNNIVSNVSQSMSQSMKSDQSWQMKKRKYDNDPFFQEDRLSNSNKSNKSKGEKEEEFQLRLPKKIINNNLERERQRDRQRQKQKEIEKKINNMKKQGDKLSEGSSQQAQNNNDKLKKYKNRPQSLQCTSPKNQPKPNIDSKILQLFKKKQDQIKQTYQKKVNYFDRMLTDSIFSPRTYTIKKNQLQQKFKQQSSYIRLRKQQAVRVVQYIQQISATNNHNNNNKSNNGSNIIVIKNNNSNISENSNLGLSNTDNIAISVNINGNGSGIMSNNSAVSSGGVSSDGLEIFQMTNFHIKGKDKRKDDKGQLQQQQKHLQFKRNQIKPGIIKQKNHIIQDYGNVNLNSHRSKSQSQQGIQPFQQSLQSQKSNKDSIFKKFDIYNYQNKNKKQEERQLQIQIQQNNNKVIKILNNLQQHHQRQQNNNKIPQKQLNNQHQHQQQIEQHNIPIINNNLSRPPILQPSLPPQHRGLETTLLFIKQYCVSFIQFLQKSQIHKSTFIQGICTPIVYDNFQLLKNYRTTTQNQNNLEYNSQDYQYIYPYFKYIYPKVSVITREAFQEFNENYQKLQGQCYYKAERQYFLNSLLDAFNQSLDYKRPCSIYGQPPPWLSQPRSLKNHSLLTENYSQQKQQFLASQKFNQICGGAIARVIQWATSLCGFIPQSPQIQNVVVEQQQINHIRQTRIALMLEKDLLQNEESILDTLIQQNQVRLQIGEWVYRGLVQQAQKEIEDIVANREE